MIALFKHVAGLAFRALQAVRGLDQHARTDADVGLDLLAQFVADQFLLIAVQALQVMLELHVHIHAVEVAIAIQMYLIILGKLFYF
ncbi:hypothetical protein D3C79_989340 [compost metagenome]